MRRYFYSLMTDEAKGPAAGIIKFVLWTLSLAYLCAEAVVFLLYKGNVLKSYRPKCKVISVGNITLGGTGKTPLVMAIAQHFRDSGKKVAILSRGYKRKKGIMSSDEVELFRNRLPDIPVFVGKDRIATAKDAESCFNPDVILLDDGFQHWRLKRDLDIVTVDINNPFGNGKLIPRGILREPVSSLRRADLIVITKTAPGADDAARIRLMKEKARALSKKADLFASYYEPSRLSDAVDGRAVPASEIKDKQIALVCGIGDPSSFNETTVSLGAKVTAKFYFMDHHTYSEKDIESVIGGCKAKKVETVITTEKDLPRFDNRGRAGIRGSGLRFLTLAIEMRIEEKEKFFGRLDSIFSRKV